MAVSQVFSSDCWLVVSLSARTASWCFGGWLVVRLDAWSIGWWSSCQLGWLAFGQLSFGRAVCLDGQACGETVNLVGWLLGLFVSGQPVYLNCWLVLVRLACWLGCLACGRPVCLTGWLSTLTAGWSGCQLGLLAGGQAVSLMVRLSA